MPRQSRQDQHGMAGNGSAAISAGELFNRLNRHQHGPCAYRGAGAALDDLWRGKCRCFQPPLPPRSSMSGAAKIRALAVTTAGVRKRCRTAVRGGEFVPGYEESAWLRQRRTPRRPRDHIER